MQTAASAVLLLLLLLGVVLRDVVAATPPHIVFILADDLGWNDVGWRNSFMPTPTLDRLAREGMILNQSYVQPSCSPSRAALMSGRYPYHLALQHDTISANHRLFLPDDQPILPQVSQSTSPPPTIRLTYPTINLFYSEEVDLICHQIYLSACESILPWLG